MRVTDEKVLDIVKHVFKNHVTIEIRSMPQYHDGDETPKHLCIVLDDEPIASIRIDEAVGTIHTSLLS